jgi:putative flippase GtrA
MALNKLSQLSHTARSSEGGRFLLFLAVGGLNTVVGYGFFVAFHSLGFSPTPAVICATIAGVMFNFLSTGRIVFASQRMHVLPRFIAVYVVQCTANVLMLHALIDAGLSILLAEGIVIALLAVATYVAMKKLVFIDAPVRGPTAS